jgi:hypothetical protein
MDMENLSIFFLHFDLTCYISYIACFTQEKQYMKYNGWIPDDLYDALKEVIGDNEPKIKMNTLIVYLVRVGLKVWKKKQLKSIKEDESGGLSEL